MAEKVLLINASWEAEHRSLLVLSHDLLKLNLSVKKMSKLNMMIYHHDLPLNYRNESTLIIVKKIVFLMS